MKILWTILVAVFCSANVYADVQCNLDSYLATKAIAKNINVPMKQLPAAMGSGSMGVLAIDQNFEAKALKEEEILSNSMDKMIDGKTVIVVLQFDDMDVIKIGRVNSAKDFQTLVIGQSEKIAGSLGSLKSKIPLNIIGLGISANCGSK